MRIISSLLSKLKKRFGDHYYNIGLITPECNLKIQEQHVINDIHWLDYNGYKKGWFADPFLYSIGGDSIKVLVEEFVYETRLGRLDIITIDKNTFKLVDVKVVLEKPTHLSFPYLWVENGKEYVMPENSADNTLTLYELKDEKLINPVQLINRPLLDAQLTKIDGKYYIFAIEYIEGGKDNECKEYIFTADSLTGPYEETQTITNKDKIERGAGAFFYENGKLIRPAQDCKTEYGKNLIFFKVEKNGQAFSEKQMGEMHPNPKYNLSRKLHTFNQLDGWTIIDGNDFRNPIVAFLTKILKYKRV